MNWSSPFNSVLFFGAGPLMFWVLVTLPNTIRRQVVIVVCAASTLFFLYAYPQSPRSGFVDLDTGYRAFFAASLFSAAIGAGVFHLISKPDGRSQWHGIGLRVACFIAAIALAVALSFFWIETF